MGVHLFRPAESIDSQPSPRWTAWRGLLYVALGRLLNWAAQLRHHPSTVRALHTSLLVVGLVVQLLLLLTVAYLIDLAVSLMELWADLARKHLEITL